MKIGEYELNKIYNEDCYEAIKKIPDNSVDCVYVDVPYLYKTGGAGKTDIAKRATKSKMELMGAGDLFNPNIKMSENLRIAKNKKVANSELLNANISDGFDYETFIQESFRVMKGCNLFIWCSPMQVLDIMNCIKKYTNATQNILVWCKTNPIPCTNGTWLSDIEYCINVRENTTRLNDGYELKSKWYISEINQKDKELYGHPTIKPLDLVKRHLLHATLRGGVVLDCFMGSGTTAVACKETERQYIGFEIDKKYYEMACNRLKGLCQEDIKIQEKGQLSFFNDL